MYRREAVGCLPFFSSPWYTSFWNPPRPSMYHAIEPIPDSDHSLHRLVVFVCWSVSKLCEGVPVANPLPTCCSPVGMTPKNGAVILTYLLNMIVNRSVLNVSNILLPEAPFHRVSVVGVSPFADRTTNRRKVTSEYRSLSSNIIVNATPESFQFIGILLFLLASQNRSKICFLTAIKIQRNCN